MSPGGCRRSLMRVESRQFRMRRRENAGKSAAPVMKYWAEMVSFRAADADWQWHRVVLNFRSGRLFNWSVCIFRDTTQAFPQSLADLSLSLCPQYKCHVHKGAEVRGEGSQRWSSRRRLEKHLHFLLDTLKATCRCFFLLFFTLKIQIMFRSRRKKGLYTYKNVDEVLSQILKIFRRKKLA